MEINDATVVVGVGPRIGTARFAQILRDRASPAAADAEASWHIVTEQGVDPLFALAVFHQESQFGLDGICATHATCSPGNTRSSRTGVGKVIQTDLGPFVRYPSWVEGWRDQAPRQVIETWAPRSDGNDPEHYIRRVVANMSAWQEETVSTSLTFGRVPHPPFQDRPIQKPANNGWEPCADRQIVGTCVHTMVGTLSGTDNYFRTPGTEGYTGALTDYGIGNGSDGDLDGVIFRWVDPFGWGKNVRPWANGWGPEGPGLEGDGPAFVQSGLDINATLISIECSDGRDPWGHRSPKQLESLAQLIAYIHDRVGVPWNAFPVNPRVGIVTQMQHYEFAQKDCPGSLRNVTTQYQARVKELMRYYQEGRPLENGPIPISQGGGGSEGGLKPVAPSRPPKFDGTDKTVGKVVFHADPRTVTVAVEELNCRKFAGPSSPITRRPLRKGETFEVLYWVEGEPVNGEARWWVSKAGSRVWVGGTVEKPKMA